ncbi:MAG: hypothetical protein ACO32J_00580 [Phycisphaerales bacterium]
MIAAVSITLLYVAGTGIGALAAWLGDVYWTARGVDTRDVLDLSWGSLMKEGIRAIRNGGPAAISITVLLLLVGMSPAVISAPAVLVTTGERSRLPLRFSMIGAGILGGLIALLIVATMVELFALLRWSAQDHSPAQILFHPVPMLLAWAVMGGLWALLFRAAGRHRDPTRIDRAVRWLFAGSLTELAIAAPTFVMACRRDRCVCGWMSWWGIVLGAATLLLLCGPMILLMRTHDARVQWMRAACPRCGYPQRSRTGTCSECGHVFGAPVAQ